MPNTLMDMFQPHSLAGNEPIGFGDAIAQNRQSLIGLGMGLLQPISLAHGAPAQSPWGNALGGYQHGAQADTINAQRQQQQKMEQARLTLARQQANRDPEAIRQLRAAGVPQEKWAEYLYPKQDASQLTKIKNPYTGEEEDVLYNPRAPQGQQFRPVPADIFNQPGTTATPGIAPAPLPVQPPALGAEPGTTTSIDPNAPSSAAPAAPRGPADLPPRVGPKAFEPEEKLRKEFNLATKTHQEVRQSYNRLLAAKDTAAGDIALIFGYMRMLDPGSVVREGEFATAQNAAGIPDMVRNMYNRALSGERLNPNQREQFKDQAGSIYEKYDQEYSARADQFRGIAKQNRIAPERVIPDLGPAPKRQDKTAAAGGDPLAEARDAIKRGAPRAAVIERLAKSGIRFNPKDLD